MAVAATVACGHPIEIASDMVQLPYDERITSVSVLLLCDDRLTGRSAYDGSIQRMPREVEVVLKRPDSLAFSVCLRVMLRDIQCFQMS